MVPHLEEKIGITMDHMRPKCVFPNPYTIFMDLPWIDTTFNNITHILCTNLIHELGNLLFKVDSQQQIFEKQTNTRQSKKLQFKIF